jgi:hypothetical protein
MKKVALLRTGKVALLGTVLAVLGLAAAAGAQTATGQISGTVRDQTGSVVPGATVTVHSELTGLTRTALTDARGDYVFALLPPSTYSVTAELQGFRTGREAGIRLLVDNRIRVDLTLTLGERTETVEVSAGTVALESESARIGQTLTEKQITELPLNGRNFLSLLFLNAGAVETTGEQGGMRSGVGNAISVQGARATSNNFMIDGTANIDTALGTPAAILSVDAMEEFTQQNKTYSAEYGFSANQINLVSKSGTNEFRGTAFLFGRSETLDARNFFDPPGRRKPELDQKQFGGTFSGPGVNPTTGIFDPAAAGPGTHAIIYSLACGTDTVHITVNLCASLTVCLEANGDLTVSAGTAPYTWQEWQPAGSTPITNQAQCQACGYTWSFGQCLNGFTPVSSCPVPAGWSTFATGTTVTPTGNWPIQVIDDFGNTLVINGTSGLPPC